LNNAILFEFAGSDDLRTQKEGEKSKGLIGDFDTKKGKHWFNGLDREIVCARDWAMSVFLVLDGSFWVDRERGSPSSLI
jgi:hypothetical protein